MNRIKQIAVKMIQFAKSLPAKVRWIKHSKNNDLDKTAEIQANVTIIASKIGYHSGINKNGEVTGLRLGRYSKIGMNVRIAPRDHIFQNFMIGDECYLNNEFIFNAGLAEFGGYIVDIGNDCWICDRSIILPHVRIGDGAVVAAGAVVTNNVPPYAVVGGVPAKFIKWRFPKPIRDELQKIKWFDWDIETLLKNRKSLENLVDFNLEQYKEGYIRLKGNMMIYDDEEEKISH